MQGKLVSIVEHVWVGICVASLFSISVCSAMDNMQPKNIDPAIAVAIVQRPASRPPYGFYIVDPTRNQPKHTFFKSIICTGEACPPGGPCRLTGKKH